MLYYLFLGTCGADDSLELELGFSGLVASALIHLTICELNFEYQAKLKEFSRPEEEMQGLLNAGVFDCFVCEIRIMSRV